MRVALSEAQIDPGSLLTGFSAGREQTGAVVSFTGLCRADSGELGLELEAYPGFTEAAIEAVLDRATARFTLQDCCVAHRVGEVAPGEPIVFVATAAAHRRAAFEAADMIMDFLKSRAPFWKKARTTEGGRWIEPRAGDYTDAQRWDGPPQSGAGAPDSSPVNGGASAAPTPAGLYSPVHGGGGSGRRPETEGARDDRQPEAAT